MRTFLLAAGSTLIALSALFHIYVFFLESIAWRKPKTWKTFGIRSQEDAEIIRPMAFNQGFYNLFLSLEIIAGFITLGIKSAIGYTLLIAGASSIVGAGLVLYLSVKSSRRAAIIQASPPVIGLTLLVVGLAK